MKRRQFLRNSLLGTAGLTALGSLATTAEAATAAKAPVKLTILHTNDMHSRIEPFPDNGGQWAGLGGMARRAALIKDIRAQEPNVLLLDSGYIPGHAVLQFLRRRARVQAHEPDGLRRQHPRQPRLRQRP